MSMSNRFTSYLLIAMSVVLVTGPKVTLAATNTLNPPFGTATTVAQQTPLTIMTMVIQLLLGVLGASVLLVFIWGGLKIVFSGGNEEKITKGRQTIVWATIGLAIILSSYSILQYVFSVLQQAAAA